VWSVGPNTLSDGRGGLSTQPYSAGCSYRAADDGAALSSSVADSSGRAVAALPAGATAAQLDHALAPTSSQLAHADMLSADASRAAAMMTQANADARTAWHVAASAFDAVTAQSPSVQLAALNIRVKNMSNSLDSAGMEAIMMMTSGMAYGAALGGGAEDDDDDFSPAIMSELENDDPMLAANIEDEEKMTVDGVSMDGAVAANIEGNGTAALTDAEIAALSPATGNPEAIVNEYRANPPDGAIGANRTVSGATWDINGETGQGVAVSGSAPRAGAMGMPEDPIFTATRSVDAEQKILESLARGLPADSTGTINLYSSNPICDSCQGVIAQFREKFPGITLNVSSG
jgi:hypothetical protein